MSCAALTQDIFNPLQEEGCTGSLSPQLFIGKTKPSNMGHRKRQSNQHSLPRPWLSLEAESGRQNQLPRAGSCGQGSALLCLSPPSSSHFPRPRAHLSGGSAPAPPGRRLLPLLGLEHSHHLRGAQLPSSAKFCRTWHLSGAKGNPSVQSPADLRPSQQAAFLSFPAD